MKPQRAQRNTLCTQKEFPLKDITERIISCAIEVHSTLGPGLLESVYEEALGYEFQLRRIPYERQNEIGLKYKGRDIGKHRIDYLVEGQVIVELKAMDKRVGLLINFNVERLKEGIKRLIISLCSLWFLLTILEYSQRGLPWKSLK